MEGGGQGGRERESTRERNVGVREKHLPLPPARPRPGMEPAARQAPCLTGLGPAPFRRLGRRSTSPATAARAQDHAQLRVSAHVCVGSYTPALLCRGCCRQVPLPGWPRASEMRRLPVPGAGPKSRRWRISSSLSPSVYWSSGAGSSAAPVFTWHRPVCACVRVSERLLFTVTPLP